MAFSSNQLPMILSFYQALEHHNSVKPIRGRTPETRPLGIRRRYEAEISLADNNKTVELKLYTNPIIKFHAHDPHVAYISTENVWPCTVTASLIYNVLGVRCFVRDNGLQIYTDNGMWHRLFTGMQLGRDIKTSSWIVLNPKAQQAYAVNRNAMAQQLKPYKKFVDYIKSMVLVTKEITIDSNMEGFGEQLIPYTNSLTRNAKEVLDIFPTSQERKECVDTVRAKEGEDKDYGIRKNHGWKVGWLVEHWDRREKMCAFLENVEISCKDDDYDLMLHNFKRLAYVAGLVQHPTRKSYYQSDPRMPYELKLHNFANHMVDRFYDIIKYVYADNIFIKEDMPIGKTKRDTNMKYVSFNTITN